ncbi:MAG: PIN domain nuclease [Candidatus Omnitrophica bacterium]|nr:PIN domain nuclease [Candidatus Omnitrophota bacterium]
MTDIMHLDTHTAIWLGMKELHRLPAKVIQRINVSTPMISPLVILEMQYIAETKKIEITPWEIIENLQAALGLEICKDPYEWVIRESLNLSWTRDPFDRLIVANSSLAQVPLLTKDRVILRNYSRAIWD